MSYCHGSKSKGELFVSGLLVATADEIVPEQNKISYQSVTGSHCYLSCYSRPNIAFEVSTNISPTKQHWQALKQLLRYLKYIYSGIGWENGY
jgi:hypothetical protein